MINISVYLYVLSPLLPYTADTAFNTPPSVSKIKFCVFYLTIHILHGSLDSWAAKEEVLKASHLFQLNLWLKVPATEYMYPLFPF